MSSLETLRESLPDAARDLKIGLQSVLGAESLTPPQRWGVALASAYAARNPDAPPLREIRVVIRWHDVERFRPTGTWTDEVVVTWRP